MIEAARLETWGMSAAEYLSADEDMRVLLTAVCDLKAEMLDGGDA